MPFVVDASVALSWCFEDEAGEYADQILEALVSDTAVAPSIWPLEVGNALIAGERRGRLAEAQTIRFAALLSRLPIEIEPVELAPALGAVLAVAREHGLSAYDAAYLELAARRGLPLATLDVKLRAGADEAGVALRT